MKWLLSHDKFWKFKMKINMRIKQKKAKRKFNEKSKPTLVKSHKRNKKVHNIKIRNHKFIPFF